MKVCVDEWTVVQVCPTMVSPVRFNIWLLLPPLLQALHPQRVPAPSGASGAADDRLFPALQERTLHPYRKVLLQPRLGRTLLQNRWVPSPVHPFAHAAAACMRVYRSSVGFVFFPPFAAAKCEPACRNGGVCMEPNKCLCKSGYSGAQCEKSEGGMPNDQEKDGILDHFIDMTSYLLDLTSYIV